MGNSTRRRTIPIGPRPARRSPTKKIKVCNPQIFNDLYGDSAAFVAPPAELISRCGAICLMHRSGPQRSHRTGRVVFDSWAEGTPVAMRNVTDGHVRCLRLASGSTAIEIVAERQQQQWEFVARVYSGQKVLHDCVLKVGGQKLLARSGGFFHWISKSVPHQIGLLTFGREVSFGRLSW